MCISIVDINPRLEGMGDPRGVPESPTKLSDAAREDMNRGGGSPRSSGEFGRI